MLTKPLGAGAVSTAYKRGLDAPLDRAIEVMTTLNRDGSLAARAAGAHGMTDVTGFGLLGHLHELAVGSGLAAELDADGVPAIDGRARAAGAARRGGGGGRHAPQPGARRSRSRPSRAGVREERRWLVCDAMTSGGLLVAIAPENADAVPGQVIGRLLEGEPGTIRVV